MNLQKVFELRMAESEARKEIANQVHPGEPGQDKG